jgi:putative two-component system response regulator
MTVSLKAHSVLIVDDDPGVRSVISRILSMNNYKTFDVGSAEDALETVKTRTFDLIVCDIHMPGMSGLEFLNELKLIDPAIATVVITSSDSVEIAIKAMKSGALGFIPKPFSSQELLEIIGAAMQSAQMVRETVGLKMFMPLLENASIALLNALEAKDHDSQGHGQRVAQRAVTIASHPALKLTAEEIRNIYFAGLFHDVGKIGVPDRVLQKGGPLNAEEMEAMAKHPEIGARIVGRVQGLEDAAKIILQHHEWYNGRGYPNKLAGEEIVIGARIITLSDAFEELTSHRIYADGVSIERAVDKIKAGSGTHFDPNLVEIFLQTL